MSAAVAFFDTPSVVWVHKDRVFHYAGWDDLRGRLGGNLVNNSHGQQFDAFAKAHPELQVVGVAVEPAEAARDYLAAHPVAYPILIGSEGSPDESQLFGNGRGVLPFTVLIGADGRIRKRRAGAFDPDELEDWVR